MTPSVEDVIERLQDCLAQAPYGSHTDILTPAMRDAIELLDLLRWRDVSELPEENATVEVDTEHPDFDKRWYDYLITQFRDGQFHVQSHVTVYRWRPAGDSNE